MECRDFDRLLDALLDGTCSPAEWARADAHLGGCARCRQLFDALGGRAGTLDEAAHASLTASILARTSGSPCLAARARLCDLIDGALSDGDRGLVEGHLAHCQPCSALVDALARSAAVLPSFAEIPPPVSFPRDVLDATSRRAAEPGIGEQVAAWLARAAMRPRFSVAVAYVATLLILLVLGDPVQAFRRTVEQGEVYARPGIVAVGERVAAGLSNAHKLGTEAMDAVASVAQPAGSAQPRWDAGLSALRQWLVSNVGTPLATAIERVSQWIRTAMDALISLVRPGPPEPAPNGLVTPGAERSTEPFLPPARLS